MNPFLLAEAKIVVTGASSGIGAAVARAVARAGGAVLLLGRDERRLAEVAETLPGPGHALAAGDLAAPEGGRAWLRETIKNFGRPDGLAHCAGIQAVEPLRFLKEGSLERTLAVNLTSAFNLMSVCRSPEVRGGREPFSAVFISSAAARGGAPGLSGYSASKGALEAAVRSWAAELAKENIRVNAVAPGYVAGAMLDRWRAGAGPAGLEALEARYPLGFGRPDDVALAVQYLLSPAARWVTGSILTIDGGFSAA